ncbi:ATP-dependent helicase [Acidianus sulfidivorans JP7]|uniref:ATP-dependent helicase n=1 Tax=Acidianus sulfidivorans JP7 TaxID=619593 RepID=A0A2U9IM50_9CREN|nr:ATP-dependent helicase [Acidianus sulfidivorans]AWR97091.1 ATP-dependent helicase [Acidianus sulfidivorans JP7]
MSIEYAKQLSDKEIFSLLRPYVASWFKNKYGSFTPPQRAAIPIIKSYGNVLVSSPTGSGKTLAAFLGILDNLFELADEGKLEDKIYAIYISPLRALNNDMYKNLITPLEEIKKEYNLTTNIKVGVRTSDTSSYQKQKMLKDPPHILITTPESFAISMLSPKFSEKLKSAKWIIVDEIHELAESKRGSFLSGFMEIFEKILAENRLSRIGLSATISPLEEVARFLVGPNRDCKIVDARFVKDVDLKVISPVRDLVHASEEEIANGIYKTMIDEIMKHKTTLVFTNTRSAAERVSYKLRKLVENEKLFDADMIGAHHSSLSRDVRLEIEDKLKKGELKVVVSSTSLELGIDIGYIDLVLLLSSPKSVSRLLQRLGRAGHHVRSISKGRIIVVDRDDLVECTVLAKLARERKIDKVHIPKNPLDVLSQIVVASSLLKPLNISELYNILKDSYAFSTLDFNTLLSVIEYLSGKHELEDKNVYAKIRQEDSQIKPKRGSRMIFYLNSGTIPETSLIPVFTENNKYVGNLEEEFVEILTPGDIFVLGGKTYEFITSKENKIIVKNAEGQRPTVPSWFSEMLPLAYDSALEVGRFRKEISDMIKNKIDTKNAVEEISKKYSISKHAAFSIYEYILEEYLFTNGKVPNDKLILIEIYDDEENRRNFIFNALYGRRTLDALSRALAYIITKDLNLNVRISVSDNGFILTLPSIVDYPINDIFNRLTVDEMYDILSTVILRTEMIKRRFRQTAERSFMILKRYKGRNTNLDRRQLNSETLLNVVKEIPNFPVLKETIREILEDYMDIRHAMEIVKKIKENEISIEVIGPNNIPSPFAHGIIAKEHADVVLAEEKRQLMKKLHEEVIEFLKSRGININLNYTES